MIVRLPLPEPLPGMWSTAGKDVYPADAWHREPDGGLTVTRDGEPVASYAKGEWAAAYNTTATTLEEAAGHLR